MSNASLNAGQGQVPGEIRKCAHCEGTGSCHSYNAVMSCRACVLRAGLSIDSGDPYTGDPYTDLPCSVCGGAGVIWVGPKIVQMEK
jgi:hypothetical protein